MINKGFYEQLEIIADERGLEREDVFNAVRVALIKAVQVEGHKGAIEVEFNDEDKKIRIYENFEVIDESITTEIDPETGEERPIERKEGDITLEEAKKLKSRVRVGSKFRIEIDFRTIGRKGASRFKQIFIQNLKECGTKRAYEYFKSKENEVITATVERASDNAVIFNLGMNTTAYMPLEDTIVGETYEKGKQVKVVVTKVEESGKGPKVYVTRSQKDIIKRLFETYIPEVATGVIDIVNIAREPGSRSKIGVISNNPNVDPKGSCVGVGGSRIREINNDLNGERMDIFVWSDSPAKNIAEALTPAKVLSVLINEDNHQSIAIVPDDQYSLAIGKSGQNVRLACQVTGWKIDIKDETTALQEGLSLKPIE